MNSKNFMTNRSWAEINLNHLEHNVQEIRKLVGKRTEILGVVKADAYGHGVIPVAKQLLESGVERLAVSMLDEAIQLRQHGIHVPILVLSYTEPSRAEEIIYHNITQTVFSRDLVDELSKAAVRLNRNVKIHIKIDTGMTRVGFMAGFNAVENVTYISKLPNIIIEGIFTHFASADEEDVGFTYEQFEQFVSICNELARIGVHIPVKHCANSATILRFPQMHLDMVRPGIILYGLYPSESSRQNGISLKPVMQIKSNVISIKDVEPDISVSYGRIYKTERQSKIATVPIGYADGYLRCLSNKSEMLINGKRAKVVGRVCMDQCMIDVTHINDVKVGDKVVIMGKMGSECIDAQELGDLAYTIHYEIISLVGKRIPRFYIKNDEIVKVLNYLI